MATRATTWLTVLQRLTKKSLFRCQHETVMHVAALAVAFPLHVSIKSMSKTTWKSISIRSTRNTTIQSMSVHFSNSWSALSILCHTVLSFHTCHPRHNYFAITPPPLPKVCRACPASHSEVSFSLCWSNPVFEQTATPGLSISLSPDVSLMLVERLRTAGIWSHVQ